MTAGPDKTVHLRPTAPLAERVLLPGDPGRALLLAQTVLRAPKMFNHHRGLWGYTGEAPDGEPLTIQSTGMGGPSAAIVIEELARLGARRLIRVGTCGALRSELALGDLLVATEAIPADGASHALGADGAVPSDPDLTAALRAAAGDDHAHAGAVVSCDLFYDSRPGLAAWREAGGWAVEMETATLFRLAALRGLRAASLLAVSDLSDPHRRLDDDALAAAGERLGAIAAAALS